MNAGYLDCFVPRTGGKNAALGCLEPLNNLDRRVMLGDLLRLSCLNIEETRSIITTTRDNLVSLL